MKKLWNIGVSFAVAVSVVQPLFAEESIEDLLKSYRKEADLSKQTKKENAGFVIVYTRDDLERMQVYRLSDLLKSMWFFRYDLNSFGMPDPLQQNPVFYSSDSIKIYVNDHEMTSGFSGSGLLFYGNIDMGMFDHVEIYYDSPVLDVATESSIAVIKLYTKEPARENGGDLVLRLGNRGMQETSASYAQVLDKWSYYAYAQESENYFRHEQNQGYDISKDYRQQHLFFNLKRENHEFEFEYLNSDHDPFTAQSMEITPIGGYWEMPFYRASYSGEWLDEKLHTDFSYIHSSIEMEMRSKSLFWGQIYFPFAPTGDPSNPVDPANPFNPGSWIPGPDGNHYFKYEGSGDVFTTKVYYDHVWERHQLRFGAEYRYKSSEVDEMRFNHIENAKDKAYFNIGSFYLQDQVSVKENAMLSLSFKYNFYDLHRKYDGTSTEDSLDTWQGRIAYSQIDDRWHYKIFLTHTELPTQLFELLLHDAVLDTQKYTSLSGEAKYIEGPDQFRLILSGNRAEDINIIDWSVTHGSRVQLVDIDLFNSVFEAIHHIDENHRIDFNLHYTHMDKKFPNANKNFVGGTLRLLDTFGKWDLFNELIFRQKTRGLDAGWDFNAGVKYHATKDLTFALKGVNIFDSAKETNYYTLHMQPGVADPILGRVTLPVVERQVYFSVEWLF